jgi:hypothetical protein
MHEKGAARKGPVCAAKTHRGQPCTQRAMAGGRLCASHAGQGGARPGNRNARPHDLYGEALSRREKAKLVVARAAEGVDDEIAMTRLMIVRALEETKALQEEEQEAPPEDYARLVEALCRQLRTQRQVRGESADSLMGALAVVLDEMGAAMEMNAS